MKKIAIAIALAAALASCQAQRVALRFETFVIGNETNEYALVSSEQLSNHQCSIYIHSSEYPTYIAAGFACYNQLQWVGYGTAETDNEWMFGWSINTPCSGAGALLATPQLMEEKDIPGSIARYRMTIDGIEHRIVPFKDQTGWKSFRFLCVPTR